MSHGRLTQGSVNHHIIRMAFPMALGLVAILSVDLIDAYWVAYLGDDALVAIGFMMPITSFFMAIGIGLSSGASVKFAQFLGADSDNHASQCYVLHVLIISSLITLFCVLIGLFSIQPLFSFLGAEPHILTLIYEYMTIWYLGMIFLVVPMVGNGLIRATGSPTWPTLIMLFAALANMALDPLLIFGFGFIPAFGIKGAALATLIVRALAMIAMLALLHFRYKIICWYLPPPSHILKSFLLILPVSASSTFSFLVNPIANGFIIALIASIGAVEVAGFNIGIRIESVALVLVIGISASTGPIVAQNYGAGLSSRVDTIRRNVFILIACSSLFFAFMTIFASSPLASVFGDNPDIQDVTLIYLLFIPLSWVGLGINMAGSHYLNATGKPLLSAFTTLLRTFILYVPLAFLLREFFDFYGIISALCIANVLSGGVSWVLSLPAKDRVGG